MKKFVMVSACLSMLTVSGIANSADFKTLTTTPATTPAPQVYTAPPATAPAVSPMQKPATAPKKGVSLKGARIVPDTTPAPAPVSGTALKTSDQGYSKASAYNVVDDRNKPITNDWTRPKNWRIGYKNKNRTPINE